MPTFRIRNYVAVATIGLVSFAALAPLRAQQTTIQTYDPNNCPRDAHCGSQHLGYEALLFSGRSFGQSFTTPGSYQNLIDFSFWFGGNFGCCATPPIIFAYLVTLTSRNTVSQILYRSPAVVAPPNPTQVTFQTPGVYLNPNSVYLAFLHAVPVFSPEGFPPGPTQVLTAFSGVSFPGGTGFEHNTLDDWDYPFSAFPWYSPPPPSNYHVAFQANLVAATVTPEPASMLLLATGLAGTALWARRRRKVKEKGRAA